MSGNDAPAPARIPVEAGSSEFPVSFADPADEALTWDWDDMHLPFAITPLAADFVRALASGFNVRYDMLGGFPQRWQAAIWNGYAYFAVRLDGSEEERAAVLRRWDETSRAQVETVGDWWRDVAMPELASLYARIDAVDPDALAAEDRAAAWEEAWTAVERAWALHFIAVIGPYQVLDDLSDAYEKLMPGAAPADAARLVQGRGDELFAVEQGLERLAAHASHLPDVAAALRASDPASPGALRELDGGQGFVDELERFLDAHGHLGQAFDDLRLPSWVEAPELLLAEIAKRIDRPAVPAARRRERLLAEAEEVEARIQAELVERPEERDRFERLLARAKEVGPLTERHNYWIDRKVQSHMRRLAVRVARWLVRQDVLDADDDVFFLTRAEIGDLLRAPSDRRATIRERRAEHARQLAIRPPSVIGAPREPSPVVDRFDTQRIASTRPDELRGMGASAGIVRGTARIARSPEDFARIEPGDVIVCPSSNPSWVPVFAIAGGLVTNTGGVLSHAAVVAREFGLPAVVGTGDATERIADGRLIEIDGTTGIVRLL